MNILALLDEKGIRYVQKTGDEIAIICPNQATHSDGVDSNASFNINLSKEVGHCFACGFSLSQVGMTTWLLGGKIDDVQMQSISLRSRLKRIKEQDATIYTKDGVGCFVMPPGEIYPEEYRGISPATFKMLEAIKCTAGRYENRICFSITQHGAFIGVDGRALGDDKPKYLRPSKCNAKEWLYPFDLAKARKVRRAILCEGIFHAVNYLDKMGEPEALCYFGSNNWSEHKTLLLLEMGLDHVVFWPDNDAAGIKAMDEICPTLRQWMDVYFIPPAILPEGPDLADFSKDEIEGFLNRKKRWK
ncbi:hypothetical protein [Geobacter sp. SVR]|uniref:hypothetical protein n=1 Tax=Geobacter sp. SVR TaxID=2495594 RepID=UPI00143EF984|nr:hypothetical protein [Geobacter sp. SVR]BCS54094.1 hypothetical protein GSVR_24020 [Geobacter sp. SVR]GCF87577.1 hypothetical protein GSbR_41770 [Geobacter sp. SVR]